MADRTTDVAPGTSGDVLQELQGQLSATELAIAALAVAACAALVFDLLPAIQLAVQALGG